MKNPCRSCHWKGECPNSWDCDKKQRFEAERPDPYTEYRVEVFDAGLYDPKRKDYYICWNSWGERLQYYWNGNSWLTDIDGEETVNDIVLYEVLEKEFGSIVGCFMTRTKHSLG